MSILVHIWARAINLGIKDEMPFIRKRSIRNLNIVSLTCAPFPLGLTLLLFHFTKPPLWPLLLGCWSSVSLLCVPVFNHFQKFHTGRLLMNISIGTTLIVDAILLGGGYGLELPFFVMLIGAFSFNEYNWEVKLYTALSFTGFITCLLIYYFSHPAVTPGGNFTVHASFAVSSLLFSFVCLSVLKIQSEHYEAAIEEKNRTLQLQKEQLQNQHDNLGKLNAAIREKNEKLGHKNFMITESLNYARRIQQSLLPNRGDLQRLLPENFVFYRPKDIVSGDFYWLEERGDTIYFAVADCTGHGVPGAFMSLMGINILHQLVREPGFDEPSKILAELDHRITHQLGPGLLDEYSREGMDITLCTLHRSNGVLKFSSAGRPVFMVRNCHVTEFKGSRAYIGRNYLQDEKFGDHVLQLNDGDTLYFFTDGFTDQFDVADRKKYSVSRLKNFLPEIYSIDMQSQLELIRKEFERWKGNTPQTDDVLMLGFRYSSEPKTTTNNAAFVKASAGEAND